MKEIKLPSGATLKISLAPFAESKSLYQAILEELKFTDITPRMEVSAVFKNISFIAFSSKKIESCVETCFKRCLYDSGKGDLKIDSQTFESAENRIDYISAYTAVIEENITPFLSGLYVEFQRFMQRLPSVPQ
ncbi:MAG: hypothetical protein JHC39_12775 [Lentimicrobium sp.]|jgi:hypothetical protein|nr:hypothetical protein [Lentimicrobium sp.]